MKLSDEKREQIQRLKNRNDNFAPKESTRKPFRIDGYVNLLNKYGTPQDNSTAYRFQNEGFVLDQDLARHYESNGLFAKIIDTPAEEAMKYSFTLGLNDFEIEQYTKDKLDELDWDGKIATAIKWARLFGGAIAVMLVDDGKGLEEPLDLDKVKSIDELRVYERACVQPDYSSMYNFGGLNGIERTAPIGMPEYYEVFSIYGNFKVHQSRCLIFRNGIMPERSMMEIYRLWGVPEYLRIKTALRETITTHGNASKLLERSVQAVYGMKNLAQLLTTDEGEDQVLKRLQVIDMARGILNSIAIDADGENYDFKNFTLSGVKDVVDSTCNMLSALTSIPQTVLFGRSPAGMSSTGESDLENYYNFIDKIRKLMLKANMRRILDIILRVGYVNGTIKEMPEYKLEFDSLWSLSEQEQADVEAKKASTNQTKAQTAQTYIELGVLDPSEVREGLKSSDEYNIEDLLDDDSDGDTEEHTERLLNDLLEQESGEETSTSTEGE